MGKSHASMSRFKPVTLSAEALLFAKETGFVSLEMEDIDMSADLSVAEPEKKKKTRKQKHAEKLEKRARGEATVEDAAEVPPPKKKSKKARAEPVEADEPASAPDAKLKKKKKKTAAEPSIAEEVVPADEPPPAVFGGDLFESLVAEIHVKEKTAKSVQERRTAAAAPAASSKKAAKAKATKAAMDEDDDDEDEEEEEEEEEPEADEEDAEDAEMADDDEAADGDEAAAVDDAASAEEIAAAVAVGWQAFSLHDELLAGLARAKFTTPTPIQAASLPPALHGRRDLVCAAETGSGKTLAFGLPILQRLLEERDDAATYAAHVQPAGGAAAAGGKKIKEKKRKALIVSEGEEPSVGSEGSGRGAERPLFALIIAPTRELAHQVATHISAVAPAGVGVISLVGGMSVEKQRRLLSYRPEIIVGTPGRLWELASDGMCPYLTQLHTVSFFVMDEVDRMIEAGHFKELRNILNLLERGTAGVDEGDYEAPTPVEFDDGNGAARGGAKKRQTFLFSATLMLPPMGREANAKRLEKHGKAPAVGGGAAGGGGAMDSVMRMIVFRNPLKVVDLSREQLVASGLEQSQISCMHDERDLYLFLLLRTRLATGRTIVFCNAVTALVRLRSLLGLLECPCIALQGNMQQRARLKALDRFKAQPTAVLLASDVAARGLDISGVEFVVHYQLPRSAEVYIHRSGRTARGGACGLSIAFVEPEDHKGHRRLCTELGTPDGLPELPFETQLLPRCREILSIAKQLDKAAHRISKKSHETKSRRQLREEMDLPTDSDDDEDIDRGDEVAKRRERLEQEQTERLKAQLKRCLGRLERPGDARIHLVARQKKMGKNWS